MPAPKYEIGKDLVARDGTKARVVGLYDYGEDGPAEYDIQTESGEIREHVAEEFLAEAPAAPAKKVPTKTPDAGATDTPVQAGGEGGVA